MGILDYASIPIVRLLGAGSTRSFYLSLLVRLGAVRRGAGKPMLGTIALNYVRELDNTTLAEFSLSFFKIAACKLKYWRIH